MSSGPPAPEDVVRMAIAAFSGSGPLDGLAALLRDDVVLHGPEGWPEQGPFVGPAAVMRQFERLREDWASHAMEIESLSVRGPWVVVRLHWEMRGRSSGLVTSMDSSGLYRFEDGRVAEMRFVWDHARALEHAGLA